MHAPRNFLSRFISFRYRYSGRIFALFTCFILLSMSGILTPTYAASTTNTPKPGWKTFLDPVYGFSLKYPSTWTLIAESNGSHITLFNRATRTTISPIITTQSGTPATVLKQALPARSIGRQTHTIAGQQAIDYLLPYVAQPQTTQNHDAVAIGGPQQSRLVIMPVASTTNTTNVYTFQLTQPTSTTGKVSAAEQADQSTFMAILNSFVLPIKVVSTKVASVVGAATQCGRVCWADQNWLYGDYQDQTTVNPGDPQPGFQCAEFVARAITQDGMIPGLNNGGFDGNYYPASSDSQDGHGYGGYLAKNGKTYYLWNVGTSNITGLNNYLTDEAGATNLGQNTSQAQPGDVIFFYGNGRGYDYTHTMIITSVSNGTILLDGHNIAELHTVLGTAQPFDLYHFKSQPAPSFKQEVYTYIGHGTAGGLEVYARGSNNNIWHRYRTGGSWSPWQELQAGGQFNGDPAVGIENNGKSNQRQEIFARGANNNIWHIWQTSADGPWISGWQELPTGQTFQGTPAVGYTAQGGLEIYARGTNNNIWHTYQSASGSWTPWQELQAGGLFNGDPVAGNYADGHQEVFARGQDNNIWHIWQTAPDGGWISGWQILQTGYAFQGTPAISYTGDRTIELFARGQDNNIWHIWQIGGHWNGWAPLQGGGQFISDPAVVSNNANGNNSTEAFAVGANHDLWHIWKSTPNGNWLSAWQDLQTNYTFQGTPAAQMDTGGSEEVFAIDNGLHSMWHNWQQPANNNSWYGWNQFDGPSGFQQ